MGVWLGVGEVRVMVMDIVGVREPNRDDMCIAIYASGRIRVRVRDGDGVGDRVRVMGRVRVRVWDRVRVMQGLKGLELGLGDQLEKAYA